MTYRRLKKPIIFTLYLIGFTLIISGILMIQKVMSPKKEDNTSYVNKTVFDSVIPVVVEQQPEIIEIIMNPYIDSTVKISKNYYDYLKDEESQKNSLIYYNGSYIPSTGITYTSDNIFDIIAVLSGTVTSVKQDDLLGNVIEISHNNEIISTYQSLSEISVQEGDIIGQGQIIGKSGTSNIDIESKNHLYFEISINNEIVNPLDYIGKSIDQI